MTRGDLHALPGSRWALPVLTALAGAADSALRFGQLKRSIPVVSQRMLAQSTRALADAGLLVRVAVAAARPPTVTYSLTARGRAALAWSAEWPESGGVS